MSTLLAAWSAGELAGDGRLHGAESLHGRSVRTAPLQGG